ncbi:hypothetical protein ACFQ88_23815 [Paenibacillus sp. NPDC056579]|uniref:hypothetical protein n=1 Tax=Paenibacillus sp. NPDC056579 TaxID=3345871 RepID=UPI0036A031DD
MTTATKITRVAAAIPPFVTKPDESSGIIETDAQGIKIEKITTPAGKITAKISLPEVMTQAKVMEPPLPGNS